MYAYILTRSRVSGTARPAYDCTHPCTSAKGTTFRSTVGSGLAGALEGQAQWVKGKFGHALQLEPKSGRKRDPAGRARVPSYRDPADEQGQVRALTISFWSAVSRNRYNRLVLRKAAARKPRDGWSLTLSNSGLAFAAVDRLGRALELKAGKEKAATPPGGMDHWVVVVDGQARRAAVYCNGARAVEKPTPAAAATPAAGPDLDGERRKPCWGFRASPEPLALEVQGFSGSAIDELAIWRRGLSHDEAVGLCNGGDGLALAADGAQ